MKHLYRALAAFQQEVPVLHKGAQGFSYTYTDLPSILRTINPLMQKHGLGFYQSINGKSLSTTVFHVESGEKISGKADIPQNVTLKGMNDFQVLGSAITYLRRYQLSAMLGLVTDKDTDGAGDPYSNSHTSASESAWSKPSTASASAITPSTNPISNPKRGRPGSTTSRVAAERSSSPSPSPSPSPSRPELKPDSVGWQRALSYLKSKGSVVDVKRKYSISPENEKALLKAAGREND